MEAFCILAKVSVSVVFLLGTASAWLGRPLLQPVPGCSETTQETSHSTDSGYHLTLSIPGECKCYFVKDYERSRFVNVRIAPITNDQCQAMVPYIDYIPMSPIIEVPNVHHNCDNGGDQLFAIYRNPENNNMDYSPVFCSGILKANRSLACHEAVSYSRPAQGVKSVHIHMNFNKRASGQRTVGGKICLAMAPRH